MDLGIAKALRDAFKEGYSGRDFQADLMAGVTVGIIAMPLAMALAIASGVAPQYGIYTAIFGGAIIALLGGSRLSVSGPTAAFVVILHPISIQFGHGGLLIATFMAGIILLLMGVARMGRLIQFIPYPVTTGFTAGIGTVIAVMQLKDFLGMTLPHRPEHFPHFVIVLAQSLNTTHLPDLIVGTVTLATLLLWPRLKIKIPGHLIAIIVGTVAAWLFSIIIADFHVETIGSRFSYELNGIIHKGIPSLPPLPASPLSFPGPEGKELILSFTLIKSLIGHATVIAILGAIESLLCAIVIDGMAGTKHDPNAELIAQGIGNLIVPFLGGVPVTGAIARSATNYKAGARTPLASTIHAFFLLAAMLTIAPLLSYLPMASLAALLLVVAWNMSEVRHFVHIVKVAPKSDVMVLLSCYGLTVIFDMVIAVSVGVVLAALLFMKRMAEIASVKLVVGEYPHITTPLPPEVRVYEIAGPLFFGAAEKAISALQNIGSLAKIVVIDMGGVHTMDMTGLVALDSIIHKLRSRDTCVVLSSVQEQPQEVLKKAGIYEIKEKLAIYPTLEDALIWIRKKLETE